MSSDVDEAMMRYCLVLARQAATRGEVPVGSCVWLDGKIIGEGANSCIMDRDPTAHAEILALRMAARRLGNYRLPGACLYVSLEPCTMCAGALVHARIARLIFAAVDRKAGAVVSTTSVLDNPGLNHRVQVYGGLLAEEAGALLSGFFAGRRNENRAFSA